MLEKYMGLVGNLNALSSRAEADYLLLLCFAAKVHYILHQLQFLVFWARLFASFFRSLFCYIYLGRVVLKEGVKNAPYLYFLLVFFSPFTLFFLCIPIYLLCHCTTPQEKSMVRVLTSVHGLLLIHVRINTILVFYLFLLRNSLSLSLYIKKGCGSNIEG